MEQYHADLFSVSKPGVKGKRDFNYLQVIYFCLFFAISIFCDIY